MSAYCSFDEKLPREKSSTVLYLARAVTYGTHKGSRKGIRCWGRLVPAASGRAVTLR
jgi:hypothetical protein